MFGKRLISGIVLVIIAILVLLQGDLLLLSVLGLVALIGTFEFLRAIKMEKEHIGIICYLSVIGYYILLYFNHQDYFMELLVGTLVLLLIIYVLRYPHYTTEHIAMMFFVILYVGVLLSYVYQVRCLEDGKLLVWLIFASAWGSDTMAYVVGMLFGKHKLPSELSPKKTVEGCIGGIVGAALIGFAISFLYHDNNLFIISPHIVFALIGVFGSLISQLGDLTASAIKRNHGIKDYGDIIPGHGGILDRFDSIIFVAPVVYYFLVWLARI